MKITLCCALALVAGLGCRATVAARPAPPGPVSPTTERLEPLGHSIDLVPDDLWVYADESTPMGSNRREVLGSSITFSEFLVRARPYTQICETMSGETGCWVPGAATFLVGVTAHSTGPVCKRFLREISEYWRRMDSDYLDNFRSLPAEKYAEVFGGSFVLYSDPERYTEGHAFLFYTSPMLVRVELVTDSSRGAGALSMFVEQHMHLVAGHDLYHFSEENRDLSPRMLLEMIAKDVIRCPK